VSLGLDKSTWQRVSFGDVVQNVNEKVKDAADVPIDRVIAMEHMDPGELKIERWGDTADGTTFTRRVRPRQTLFGKRRAYQRKVAYAEFDAICSGDIYTFEADETRMLGDFLPFLVQSDPFFDHALDTSAGSLSPRTNWRDLADFEFELPPLQEQERFAELLWTIELHCRGLANSREAALSLVQQLRVSRLEPHAWTTTLDNYMTGITAGRSLLAGTTSAGPDTHGVLKVSAVSAHGFVAAENKELIDQDAFLRRYSLRRGDLLITRANTSEYVGRAAVVDDDYPRLMLSDKTLRLEIDQTKASAEFVLEVLQTPRMRALIGERATGTGAAMKNLSQGQIRSLPAPDVDREQQAKLVAEIGAVSKLVDAIAHEVSATYKLKKSLLAELFGGN